MPLTHMHETPPHLNFAVNISFFVNEEFDNILISFYACQDKGSWMVILLIGQEHTAYIIAISE